MTRELPAGEIIIDDTNIAADQGRMRGLIAQRLEMVWATVQPHLDGTVEELGYRPDPRMVQAAIHVLDRLERLYRLDKPAPEGGKEPTAATDRALVATQLAELEAKINSTTP